MKTVLNCLIIMLLDAWVLLAVPAIAWAKANNTHPCFDQTKIPNNCIFDNSKSVNKNMQSKSFEKEFLKNLELLSKGQQDKALAYIKSLLTRRRSQAELLQFAGSLDAKSIREMSEAIEAGCETIDKNEW